MNTLNPPSEEQKEIVDNVFVSNQKINAVAGSGKTTTVLHIASAYPKRNMLLLTYNKHLKFETRDKLRKLGLTNMESHSYHSFAVTYYNTKAYTDVVMRKNVINNKLPRKRKFKYDLILVDETQDMMLTYFALMCKIYRDNENPNCFISVLGDLKQSINQYKGSDLRFLSHSEMVYPSNGHRWVERTLSVTYRVPNTVVSFLNQAVLKNDTMKAVKKIDEKPRYGVGAYTGTMSLSEVKYYLKLGYENEDIFVLCPSLKGKTIRKTENTISSLPGVNVFFQPVKQKQPMS